MSDTLVQEIQRRLKALKLTPITAAQKAGLGRDSIRDIIRGKSQKPSHATLIKIAGALQCRIEDLTGEEPGGSDVKDRTPSSYHSLEWQLCLLFQDFTRLHSEEAGLIFYALSAPARREVLNDLKFLRHPDRYPAFWQSLLYEIEKADRAYSEFLRHSERYTTRYSGKEMHDFRDRCDWVGLAATLFRMGLQGTGSKIPFAQEALEMSFVIPPVKGHPFAALEKELMEEIRGNVRWSNSTVG